MPLSRMKPAMTTVWTGRVERHESTSLSLPAASGCAVSESPTSAAGGGEKASLNRGDDGEGVIIIAPGGDAEHSGLAGLTSPAGLATAPFRRPRYHRMIQNLTPTPRRPGRCRTPASGR